ncbi:serine/threonine-protein kinase PRP4 homolog isoform X2 [Bombyx mori]|uniref:Uncharacterized protein n=1 Tax=Bombyx mori TaxID=7091 RepID=A0A8R2HTF1_BOMMO|nr:serine/threonine-protein kinase PRP4 homolog isoform X2 [Bombyx mori]
MECQPSDSKKLFKVSDSKCKRARKKREGQDNANDEISSGSQATMCRVNSAKPSLQELFVAQNSEGRSDVKNVKRRDGISLALKAGMVSTPRSISPNQEGDGGIDSVPRDQDSFIYAFLEEAIKRDKKKQRHRRRHDRHGSCEREASTPREHRRHRHRRDDVPSKERDKPTKDVSPSPGIDQTALFETFAKLCAQMNDKKIFPVPRTQSHKSLQCEVTRRDSYNVDRSHERYKSHDRSRDKIESNRSRCHDIYPDVSRSKGRIDERIIDRCASCYSKDIPKYASKLAVKHSKMENEDRYPGRDSPRSEYERYRQPERDTDYADKRRYFEQKASRSFEVNRNDDRCRRTSRSDNTRRYDEGSDCKRYVGRDGERDRKYDERKYIERSKYCDRKPIESRLSVAEQRSRRNYDRNSVESREDEGRDRYSERERDSGLSVADGETSTASGKSNYLRFVKQEITEQREAMDKMMKLWKELMRCFKGVSQTPGPDKSVHESASNVRESAAAHLRLWRECMRRYETVARDVGDTDARLMEEINKQRSEMAEMASMWQECLQRYRDMSNDFNNLKQKLTTPESPTRLPAPPATCAEGEVNAPAAPYRVPTNYPQFQAAGRGAWAGSAGPGSALRGRASVPPWWWGEPPRSPRRRSSPDSRGSGGSRERRHRHKDKNESRYKEKSKPSGARSEHRHNNRKR